MPSVEELILHAALPKETREITLEARERTVLGHSGHWLNEHEERNFSGVVNINEYKINNDPNVEHIVKEYSKPVRFFRNILVRRLKPPKPP